LISIPDLGWV